MKAGIALVLGFVLGCESKPEALLQVGTRRFSAEDIALRTRLAELRFGTSEGARLGAFCQLIQGALLAEVLATLGSPIGEKELTREAERVARDTKDPVRLARIKEICGGGATRAYREIYLLPEFANRTYYFEVCPRLLPANHPPEERFWTLAAPIPVRLRDASIREEFRKSVSWAGRVKLVD